MNPNVQSLTRFYPHVEIEMMKKTFLLLSVLVFSCACTAQQTNNNVFERYQDTLIDLRSKAFKERKDEVKLTLNEKFLVTFEKVLQLENSFSFSFDSLKGVARLTAPDQTFKIYNWNLQREDGSHEYFGFIQRRNPKTKKVDLFVLSDKSAELKNPENSMGDHRKWFGVLYYDIIQHKHKRKKYYTLLAWDGNDKLSQKKIIDVISFSSDGIPRFGDQIFKLEKKHPRRVIFEYSSQVVMSVKYHPDKNMIIFDHLAPPQPSLTGQFQYYGPDFSYDGLKFKKGKWIYVADVDARNPRNSKDKNWNKNTNKKSGLTEPELKK